MIDFLLFSCIDKGYGERPYGNSGTFENPSVSALTDSPGRPLWTNLFGPAALDNLVFYVVESDASFSCASAGSRCAFLRSDFEEIDDTGGAFADQQEGTVWTVGTLHLRSKACPSHPNSNGKFCFNNS